MLSYAHSINQEEAILAIGIGSDITQLLITNSTDTTPFHLYVQRFRSHITHEHYDFERFYVCSCSYQRTSHSNTEVLIIAELSY